MNKWKLTFWIFCIFSLINYIVLLPPIIKDLPPNLFYSQLLSPNKLTDGELLKVNANPSRGFNYDYYLFIPNNMSQEKIHFLLFEPNNTGKTSDDMEEHENSAKRLVSYGWSHKLANDLQTPLMVPVFPRSRSQWRIYTHSLDRDSVYTDKGELERIDRQFIKND